MVDQLDRRGEARPGQREMARLAADALGTGSSVAIRAGTGTGKSLAVLAALAATLGNGRRAVLATTTKALQDQYVDKEVPVLVRAFDALGEPALSWAVLKGRANYLCRLRFDELAARAEPHGAQAPLRLELGVLDHPTGTPPRPVTDPERERVVQLRRWAATTGTGDLAELPFEIDHDLAAWVSTTPEACPGAARCPHGQQCWAEHAIDAARHAQLVVVNLALLGADLALGSALVGEVELLAIDEAHDAEDVLAVAFGASLTLADVERAGRHARSLGRGGDDTGAAAATGAPDRLRRSLRRTGDRLGELLASRAGQRLPNGLAGDAPLHTTVSVLAQHVSELQRLARQADVEGRSSPAMEICRRDADRLAEATGRLLAGGARDAVWVEDDATTLRRLPVDLGDRLATTAWQGRPVLLTSASVGPTTAGRLGLPDAELHDVGSPFDHRRAAWLYVPELLAHVPIRQRSPSHAEWFDAAWAEAARIIEVAEGRTLVLCTSVRNAERFADRARRDLAWPVLAQGDSPTPVLLARFAREEHSILVGTMGLWQGVDVPGPSLSCVIVDRLPFPRPDDPLWQARTELAEARVVERGGSPRDAGYQAFLEVSVPRAATLLSQGTGRLIRTATDRGLVVVLDPRLAEKPYRQTILDALPPMRRTRSRHDALEHLRATTGPA
jgi:ATP-dependent DNA helicase DinG